MSAIPKDIAAKADAVYDALGRGSLADTGAIARAIFAERERCAQVVRSIAKEFRDIGRQAEERGDHARKNEFSSIGMSVDAAADLVMGPEFIRAEMKRMGICLK